jgi:hypothetical protein
MGFWPTLFGPFPRKTRLPLIRPLVAMGTIAQQHEAPSGFGLKNSS